MAQPPLPFPQPDEPLPQRFDKPPDKVPEPAAPKPLPDVVPVVTEDGESEPSEPTD